MKRLFLLPLCIAFVLNSLCVSAQFAPAKNTKKTETKAKVKTQNVKMKVKGDLSAVALPYPINYSSQFVMGDPAYSKLVLDLWKGFDNNSLDQFSSVFADTVAIRLSNGAWLRGFQEVFDGTQTYRASLASVESSIDGVMSVHSIDKDEDWVLVWGSSKETDKNGTTQNIPSHELWRINKGGKVDLMLQYTYTEPKK